jgi:hypothetical protein
MKEKSESTPSRRGSGGRQSASSSAAASAATVSVAPSPSAAASAFFGTRPVVKVLEHNPGGEFFPI